ncbi:hypothetical protein HPB49_005923 [Dermacentor silvarum]|uniref:Uncharacterized protein n=1 Tax=Dermacentor silvarum TaxID=543639 RepID=A0ACB8DW31_DERSI|nr:hypothetical protein HPB49_005923 [Dermacentor silvarum]
MIFYMGAITQLDEGIEAAKAEADVIEEELLIVNNLMMTIDSVTERSVNRDRWSFSRRTRCFEETVSLLGERFFKRAINVTPATFRYTVDSVRPLLGGQTTNMRESIALDKRVAICLHWLCSSAEDHSVAEWFAVGRSSVNVAYRGLCEAVIHTMEAEWINMPTASSVAEHLGEFMTTLEFPQAMGSQDGCHFPVSPPKESATDYTNYTRWYSIILLALVDRNIGAVTSMWVLLAAATMHMCTTGQD